MKKNVSPKVLGILTLVFGLLDFFYAGYYYLPCEGTPIGIDCVFHLIVVGLLGIVFFIFLVAYTMSLFSKKPSEASSQKQKKSFFSFKLGPISLALIILFIVWLLIRFFN